MDIDVVNIFGLHSGILESVGHGEYCAEAFGVGGRQVVCVGREASAHHFGIDFRSTGQSMFELLKHKHSRTFSHHEAVTAGAEWARSRFGAVVSG